MVIRDNYSDQRYFHSIIMVPRKPGISSRWLLDRLSEIASVDIEGSQVNAATVLQSKSWRAATFVLVNESPTFAGSETAANALRVEGKPFCAYMVFIGEHICRAKMKPLAGSRMESFLLLGTGYAALTRYLAKSLVDAGKLLKSVLFLRPTLSSVLSLCESHSENTDAPIELTVTGIDVIAPGTKGLINGVRLAGDNVLESGLLPKIEAWLRPKQTSGEPNGSQAANSRKSLFRTQGVRITSKMPYEDNSASLSFNAKGASKFWLRKDAKNFDPFAAAIADLTRGGAFFATSELPGIATESEF